MVQNVNAADFPFKLIEAQEGRIDLKITERVNNGMSRSHIWCFNKKE